MTRTLKESLNVKIWRGTANTGQFQNFSVPTQENQTVLDVVTDIQRNHAPDLTYRFACRVGVCGSCAMTVNGVPRWTCRTHVSKVTGDGALKIEPLRNMAPIRDLACDMTDFFGKWEKAGGQFAGTRDRNDAPQSIKPASRARRDADAAIECINCGVCHAACDVVSWDEGYLGPAALNRAWTLVRDERHGRRKATLDTAMADGGCSSCHTQGNCMRLCPVGLSPTQSIAGLKRMSLLGFLVKDEKPT